MWGNKQSTYTDSNALGVWVERSGARKTGLRVYLEVHGNEQLLIPGLITLLITPLNDLIGVTPISK